MMLAAMIRFDPCCGLPQLACPSGQMLSAVMASLGSHEDRIWKLVAHLGRYGHQPADVVLRMPMRRLKKLSDAVNEIVREEAEAVKHRG